MFSQSSSEISEYYRPAVSDAILADTEMAESRHVARLLLRQMGQNGSFLLALGSLSEPQVARMDNLLLKSPQTDHV